MSVKALVLLALAVILFLVLEHTVWADPPSGPAECVNVYYC